MTYLCYSTLGTKSYKAVVWEYTTQQKWLIVRFFGHTPVFKVDHEKGLTLTEVADGVSVEDVSSCTDEQTKKLTTVHIGAVFEMQLAGCIPRARACTSSMWHAQIKWARLESNISLGKVNSMVVMCSYPICYASHNVSVCTRGELRVVLRKIRWVEP